MYIEFSIYFIPIVSHPKFNGAENNIPIEATILSYVKAPKYVCFSCGYSEE